MTVRIKNYTEEQIKEMRKKWNIREDFVPLVTAGGAIAWGKPLPVKGE